jgi:hypothetical protein
LWSGQLSEEFHRNQIKHLTQLGVASPVTINHYFIFYLELTLKQTNDVNCLVLGLIVFQLPASSFHYKTLTKLSRYIFDLYRPDQTSSIVFTHFPAQYYTSSISSYKYFSSSTINAYVSQYSPSQRPHQRLPNT